MNSRHNYIAIAIIILVGFLLRFYGALSIPLTSDEREDFRGVKDISFNLENLKLPLVDKDPDVAALMGHRYLVRLGWDIFGESPLGARLPFVVLGTLTILLVYFLTKSALGTDTALLAALLLSISQWHVGITRTADYAVPHEFFVVISLFLFYRGITTSNRKLILLNGAIIGIGFWFRESIVFLLPIYIIFLYLCREYRLWLRDRYLWGSFVVGFLIMLPLICLLLRLDVPRLGYIYDASSIGPSLNVLGFYLGELILLAIKPFPNLFNYVVGGMNSELPIVNFTLGLLILFAVIKSFKDKRAFIRLLVVCFSFNFVVFSFIRERDCIDSVWSLGSLNWSVLGFVPGVILTSNILRDFIKRNKYYGRILFIALVLFMFIRTWGVASFPLNCYFPTKDSQINRQFEDVDDFLKDGNSELAEDILVRVYRVNDSRHSYKKRAALMLATVLIQEGNYAQSEGYLNYVLSQDPDDSAALNLLEELRQKKVR